MKIKAIAFNRYYVTIVSIYDDCGVLWAICITENGTIIQYKYDDLKVIDEDYLPKGDKTR